MLYANLNFIVFINNTNQICVVILTSLISFLVSALQLLVRQSLDFHKGCSYAFRRIDNVTIICETHNGGDVKELIPHEILIDEIPYHLIEARTVTFGIKRHWISVSTFSNYR